MNFKEWPYLKWGDIAELKYGKALKGYKNNTSGIPVFGTNGQIGYTDKAMYKGPSIIIGRKGAYRGVHYTDEDFYVIDTAYYLVPKMNINIKWAYYELLLKDINLLDSGSAIPSTSREDFYSLKSKVPPLEVQNKIVEILDDFEKKIKVNKNIITNLELLAQTIFKHWLIDFEFPNEQGKPYKLSGGEMVESELGEIPKGWNVKKLGEIDCVISDHVANGSFKSLKDNVIFAEATNEGYALFARNVDLKKNLTGELKYITKESYDFLKKSRLFGGEIIISNVGDVGTVHRCPNLNIPMVLGNNQIYLSSEKEFYNEYLYLLFKNRVGIQLINSITSGSVQMKFNKTDFRNSKIVFPSDDFLKTYFSTLKYNLDSIEILIQENQKLSQLRDTLLPKFLSGEIEIPDELEVK